MGSMQVLVGESVCIYENQHLFSIRPSKTISWLRFHMLWWMLSQQGGIWMLAVADFYKAMSIVAARFRQRWNGRRAPLDSKPEMQNGLSLAGPLVGW